MKTPIEDYTEYNQGIDPVTDTLKRQITQWKDLLNSLSDSETSARAIATDRIEILENKLYERKKVIGKMAIR